MKRFLGVILCAAVIGVGFSAVGAAAAEVAAPEGIAVSETSAEEREKILSKGPGASENAGLLPSSSGRGTTADDREYGPGFVNNADSNLLPVKIPANNFLDKETVSVVTVTDRYSYDDMVQDIQLLQQNYQGKFRANVVGTSHDGRNIYELIVGNENAPRHILIQGGIHAREYMTPLLMMRQIETALANYDSGVYDGMSLSDMFNQVALHFIPMSNPDGIALSEFGLGAIRSETLKQAVLTCYAQDTAQGRTSQPMDLYLQRWKANAAGVDLNQNFPANWENIQTTATSISYTGYKGAAPLSEPESQTLAAMADRYPWSATISYHSMGNIIYWDTSINKARDASLALARTVSSVTGYPLDGSDGRGGFKDWMQSKENPVPGITIEVGSVTCPMPVSEYWPVWSRNKAVWVQAMAYVIKN